MAEGSTNTETNNDRYGVSETIAGYTIESINITDSDQREQVHNQTNAVVKELIYDTRYDLKCTLRGASKPSAATFNGIGGANVKWIIDSIEDAGTYNGLRRWNVAGHRYTNCNEATAASAS